MRWIYWMSCFVSKWTWLKMTLWNIGLYKMYLFPQCLCYWMNDACTSLTISLFFFTELAQNDSLCTLILYLINRTLSRECVCRRQRTGRAVIRFVCVECEFDWMWAGLWHIKNQRSSKRLKECFSLTRSLTHSLSHSLTLDLHVDTHPDLRAAFSRPWYTTQTRRNWEALCLSHTHTLSKDSVTQRDWEWNGRLKNQLSRNLICLCVIQTDEDLLMWNCQINDQWGLFEELLFETRILWCHWFEIHGVRDFLQITGTLSWHLSKTVFFEYFSSSTTVLVDVNETWLGNVNTHYSSKIWAQ